MSCSTVRFTTICCVISCRLRPDLCWLSRATIGAENTWAQSLTRGQRQIAWEFDLTLPPHTNATTTWIQSVPSTVSPIAPRRLNAKKLLLTKWTAAKPQNKEKHFIVTRLIEPEVADAPIELVELEATYSKRSLTLPWRDLKDETRWLQGWK